MHAKELNLHGVDEMKIAGGKVDGNSSQIGFSIT